MNRSLVRLVDVVIGNEEDFSAALGIAVDGRSGLPAHRPGGYRRVEEVAADYPNLGSSRRHFGSPDREPQRLGRGGSPTAPSGDRIADLDILDRIGGGDSFASGLIYGLMAGKPVDEALEYGAAHGALAMTTPATPRWRRSMRSSGSSGAAARAWRAEVRDIVSLR